jgi:membrane protease subunit HflC
VARPPLAASQTIAFIAMTNNPNNQLPSEAPPVARRSRRAAGVVLRGLGLPLLLFAVSTSMVFVDETEFVLIERLGRIVAVYDNADPLHGDRGLHWKLPWPISTTRRFDRRQQLFDPPGREMFTRDRKNITVSAYACWRIAPADPAGLGSSGEPGAHPVVTFFQTLGSMRAAEALLEARTRAALSTEIGRVDLSELLNAENSEAAPQGASPLALVAASTLARLRSGPEGAGLREALGIELVDLRIKRINLPEGNRLAVYERMRSERERIAERYRSAGQAESLRIESLSRRKAEEILARADADAERIKGEGDAEAIRILNQSHARDPEFYEFERTLAAYGRILTSKTTLVLSSGSRLFRLLTEGVGEAARADVAPKPGQPPREPEARGGP